MFGPGQCSKQSNNSENNEGNNPNTSIPVIKQNGSYHDNLSSTDFDTSIDTGKERNPLIDSVLSFDYPPIRIIAKEYSIDSALNILREARLYVKTEKEREIIQEFAKTLLIEKAYDVDKAYKNTAAGLTIIEKNNKYGFINKEGKVVYEPIFQEIEPLFFYPYTLIKKDNKWGAIDSFGVIEIPMVYDSIDIIMDSDRYFKLFRKEYIDIFDLLEGEFKYQDLTFFDRIWANHIILEKDGRYQLLDLDFKKLIPGDYDHIELIDGGDDFYIKALRNSTPNYYNLSMETVRNPIVN